MSSAQSRLFFLSQNLAAVCEVRGFEQVVAELRGWIQEKATLMERDTCDHSLSSVQTLQQQHRCLEVRACALWASCLNPSLKTVVRGRDPSRPVTAC